jgi:hypothetical protein
MTKFSKDAFAMIAATTTFHRNGTSSEIYNEMKEKGFCLFQ